MPERQQKNARLSAQANQALRALKFDLELSDGEVIEEALAATTLHRATYHISALRRIRSGLVPASEGPVHRAALEAALHALNYEAPKYRVRLMRLEVRTGQDEWAPVRGGARYGTQAEEVLVRARDLAAELGHGELTVPILLIACCEGVPVGHFASLAVPEADLARLLRREVGTGAAAPEHVSYDLETKAVILEGAYGIAALEGTDWVGPEHLLVACLQSLHPVVTRAIQSLHLAPDLARARLLEWLPEWDTVGDLDQVADRWDPPAQAGTAASASGARSATGK